VNSQNQLVALGANAVFNDIAGNLTFDGSLNYAWDAENRLSSVAGVSYSYDGDGQRVQKSSGTTYWYGPDGATYEETDASGNTIADYIYFGGKRFARRDASNNTIYYVPDQLGTTRAILNSIGSPCYDSDFYPFGGEINYTNTCPQNYKFTGKERDSESGLDNFGARYDSSSLGRFMTPDPLGGSLANPQSLNKYAYALNNPLRFTDPTGLYVCADDPKDGSSHCASKQDQAFEKALDNLRGSKGDVGRAAAAYGGVNEANGVTVGFADVSKKGEGGDTVSHLGTLDGGNTPSAISNVTISTQISGSELDAAIGHEGSHVADAQDVVKSGIDFNALTPGSDITRYQSEQRAYGVSNAILSTENDSKKFDCGMMRTCSLGTGTMIGQLPSIIDDILAHNPKYNVNGRSMSSTNQGGSIVNGVNHVPSTTVPH